MSFKGLNSIHFKHHLQYSPHHFLSEAMSSWTASQHICSCPRIQFQTSLTLLLLLPSLALLKSILSHTLHKLNWTSIFPHKSLQWASPTLVWVCSFSAAFHQPLQQSIPSAALHQHNAGLSETKKKRFCPFTSLALFIFSYAHWYDMEHYACDQLLWQSNWWFWLPQFQLCHTHFNNFLSYEE